MADTTNHSEFAETHQSIFEIVDYSFSNVGLLTEALTHRSFAHERNTRLTDNERLEFLGDAVIGLAVGRILLERYPAWGEGLLSRWRSYFVSRQVLAELSQELGFDKLVLLGRGEVQTGGRAKTSILAGVFEAVLGAMFLDGGINPCDGFLRKIFETRFNEISEDQRSIRRVLDTKTYLQECVQAHYRVAPNYQTLAEWGLDHERFFRVALNVQGRQLSVGEGRSKKEAENQAALSALEIMGL